MKSPVLLALVFVAAALSGCALDKPLSMPEVPDLPTPRIPSVADLPFVYQIEVQQGNVITQEMIAQLRIGMDKKKVNFVMGSPIIIDTFHGNRWDYLYTIDTKGKKPRRRRITLFFEDDLLARIEGDVVPASAPLAVDTRQDMTVDVPKPEKKNVVAKLAAAVPFVGDDDKKAPKKATTTTASAEPKPAPKPRPAPPELTPIQRARLEEMAPPSMMGTLAGALPFVDPPEHQPLAPGRKEDEEEEEDVETELEEELEEDMEVEEEDEDGLFQSLTGALPFVGDKEEDEETTSSDAEESADVEEEEEVEPEEDETSAEDDPVEEEDTDEADAAPVEDEEAIDAAAEDPAADEADEDGLFQSLTEALPFMGNDEADEDDAGDAAGETTDDEESQDAEDTVTDEDEAVVSTPVAVPMPQPLENQVPEDDSAEAEGSTGKSKGFFDRWFGRD